MKTKGFTATTAVILLATGTLAFSLGSLVSAALYADSVNQKELRIQARLNASACLDTVILMAYKDYFLNGPVTVPEFGCTGNVSNDYLGHISMNIKASLEGVSYYLNGEVAL
ncbi:MAG: hypothetical protein NTZ38_01935 [Candidatus Taylorbacteria bacterium]|nr:hypothetical protein [Candidatus Taylorbacteria bacterium]